MNEQDDNEEEEEDDKEEEDEDDKEEEDEDDKEEEVQLLEKLEREKETERAEQAAEEMVKTFISRSLEVLDDLDNDMMKLKKNACQKDIMEKFMLYWNKIE